MYGFSGYGTNSYASKRQTPVLSQVIRFGARVFQSVYNIAVTFMLPS
jgi:hypothetical protein